MGLLDNVPAIPAREAVGESPAVATSSQAPNGPAPSMDLLGDSSMTNGHKAGEDQKQSLAMLDLLGAPEAVAGEYDTACI